MADRLEMALTTVSAAIEFTTVQSSPDIQKNKLIVTS